MLEVLTTEEMAEADRLAGAVHDSYTLMRNAGRHVARAVLLLGDMRKVHVLCGPGNNGGDGYVAARALIAAGVDVAVHAEGTPRPGSDAARAHAELGRIPAPLADFLPGPGDVVIDALFGAGLARHVDGAAAEALGRAAASGARIVAVDLPSGVSGNSGAVLGFAAPATVTVTFFRYKPGHLLYPGRGLCGRLVPVDIGIPVTVLDQIRPLCRVNRPPLWRDAMPRLSVDAHKYARGMVRVFSGGPTSTGAARLAARAAQRAGAGAVTVLSPSSALLVNACHLTSIMLERVDGRDDVERVLGSSKRSAYVLGPGFGLGERVRAFALQLAGAHHDGLVLDADAITALAEDARGFFERPDDGAPLVLTPHDGEFRRLFPELAGLPSKLERARRAARLARAVVILKGPDTVIAAPDGRAAINVNGTPALATAGSGDVLAGIVAALLSRGMPAFEAAAAAVWLHGESGQLAGANAIAEDLPEMLPRVFASLTGAEAPIPPPSSCADG